MMNLLFRRLVPTVIGITVVVVGAMWLYGFIGVKAGFVGPTDIPGLNAVSHHGAETAGGIAAATKTKLGL